AWSMASPGNRQERFGWTVSLEPERALNCGCRARPIRTKRRKPVRAMTRRLELNARYEFYWSTTTRKFAARLPRCWLILGTLRLRPEVGQRPWQSSAPRKKSLI